MLNNPNKLKQNIQNNLQGNCKFCKIPLFDKLISWEGWSVCYTCYERRNLFTARTKDFKRED